MDTREQRGIELAKSAKIRRTHRAWYVPSQNGKGHYSVTLNGKAPHCNCPDYELRGKKCKHIFGVEHTVKREAEHEKPKPRVRSWPSYNASQTSEKGKFVALLSNLCRSVPEPIQARGRPRLPLSDMLFASAYKVYVGFSARRFSTDLKEAQVRGLIKRVAHFNSVNRYLADPQLTDVLKSLVTLSNLPLKTVENQFCGGFFRLLYLPICPVV
jgi:SWIM zinc finger